MATATKSDRELIDEARAELDGGVVDGIDLDPQDVHDGDDEPDTDEPLQLSFRVGGKKPTSTQLRLGGGKIDIADTFVKGQTVELRVTATVGAIEFVDERDRETSQVVGCQRRHKLHINSVSVA